MKNTAAFGVSQATATYDWRCSCGARAKGTLKGGTTAVHDKLDDLRMWWEKLHAGSGHKETSHAPWRGR